jgi:hypothetical protein
MTMAEPDEQPTEERERQPAPPPPAASPPSPGWAPFYPAPPSPFEQATGGGGQPPPPPRSVPPPRSAPPGEDPTLWLRPPTVPGGSTAPAPPGDYLGAPAPTPWPTPTNYRAPDPENGKATAAMILGIAGLGLWFTLGFGLFFFVNLPCSVLAWVYGIQGRRRIEAGVTTRGEGAARAGVVMGVVGVILGLLAIVGWAMLFVLAI